MNTRGVGTPEASRADEELRELFALSIAMLCIAGKDGYFQRVSPSFERTLGYTREELLSRPFIEFVHPEDRDRTLAEVRKLSEGNPTIRFVNRYACRDGSYRWLAWTAMPEVGGTRIYATATDVTEARQTEEALRRSEERYRRLLTAVTAYTYTVRLEEGVPTSTDHGAGCLAATGYRPEDYAADPDLWITMVHPDDRERVWERVSRVLQGEDVPPIEHRIVHRDGTTRWVRDTIVPHRDGDGALVRYDGLVEDVTDRKSAEERFRQLLEYAPDAMVVADEDGRIMLVNAQAERLFGYEREELLGRPVEVLVPEHLRDEHRAHCAGYYGDPKIGAMGNGIEFWGLRKDGTQFPADIRLSPLRTERGILVTSEIHDLTRRRQTEKERETALRVQRAIGSLLRALLESTSLEDKLEATLDVLFSIPWLSVESKGCIFLVEDDPRQLVMRVQRGLAEELLELCGKVPFGTCLCGRAAATGEVVFTHCLDEGHETRYPGIQPHGHFCVPIVSEGQVYGVINLYVKEGHERQPIEEAFLLAVADALAGAVKRHGMEDALRKNRSELLAAQQIQQALLPRAAPALAGLDIAGATYPADYAAGDYFDYLPMLDGSVGFVVADVSGHGVAPALLMATTRAYLRLLAHQHGDIGEMLAVANDILTRETEDHRFVSLFLGRLDPETRSLVYVSAGHPTGYLLDPSGRIKSRLRSTSMLLAIAPGAPFASRGPITLDEGDILLLLTDGVYEAMSPQRAFFGEERALEIVRANSAKPASEIVRSLYLAVRDFTGREKLNDDVTAVVIKVGPGS